MPIGGKMHVIEGSKDELSDVDSATFPEVTMTPESDMLSLPSSLAVGEIHRQLLHSIAIVKAELRRAQINDLLHRLCLALGEKAMSFRADVCNAKSQWTSLRAWATVHKWDSEARKHRNIYNHARAALICLDCCPDFLSTLHDITGHRQFLPNIYLICLCLPHATAKIKMTPFWQSSFDFKT
jgi:hypothetical protein